MRLFVTGASGFIGAALCRALVARGDTVVGLSRRPRPATDAVSFVTTLDAGVLAGCDAVVNLAGESIAGRWTAARKRRLVTSRIDVTRQLVLAMQAAQPCPSVVVSVSGVSYYGAAPEHPVDETAPPGEGFLARLTRDWEEAVKPLEGTVRLVVPRLGVVLGTGGGALAKMLPVFRAGLGGPVGGGEQWLPWISRHDVVRFLVWCVDGRSVRGALNAVAPELVRQRQLATVLGQVLKRPAVVPTPALALKLVLGTEMVNETLLSSQRVVPRRALELGFRFEDPLLEGALRRALAGD